MTVPFPTVLFFRNIATNESTFCEGVLRNELGGSKLFPINHCLKSGAVTVFDF
jgi:hypothetical protein